MSFEHKKIDTNYVEAFVNAIVVIYVVVGHGPR